MDGRLGLGGPGRLFDAAPGHVHGVLPYRPQLSAGLAGGRPKRRQGLGAVQARIVADHLAGAGALAQPGGDPAFHQIADLEQLGVDLIAHLDGVAAIHKDGGRLGRHRRRAGRTGEAGRPGQPVVGFRQVLVPVLVLVGNEEAVQALTGELLADERDVLGPETRIGGLVKGLAHALMSKPSRSPRHPGDVALLSRSGPHSLPGRRPKAHLRRTRLCWG